MPRAIVYQTARNHPKTQRIMSPVAQGLEQCGYQVRIRDSWSYPEGKEERADLLAIWGDFHGTQHIFADREKFKQLIHIDNAYIGRGHYQGYYSVSFNAKQATHYLWDGPLPDNSRWKALGEKIRPWQKDGTDILVLGLSRKQCQNLGFDYPQWNKDLLEKARAKSGRRCVLREKRYDRLNEPLRDVLRKGSWYAVVGYNTKGFIEALLEGIPVYALGKCACYALALSSLDQLQERFFSPKREEFFQRLAWHQWKRSEIATGAPFRHLSQEVAA